MTLRELRSDIELIAEKSKVSKDHRLERPHLNFLIHKYAARSKRESFQRQGYIDPVWIQNLGIRTLTPVDSGEELPGYCSGITLGKVVLPRILSLPDDKGVVRVSGTSQHSTYYGISIERFFDLDRTSLRAKIPYYMRSGDDFYLYPTPNKAHFRFVLDNPMDGDFFDNTLQQKIQEDLEYEVSEGAVTYDGTNYVAGDTFIGQLATTWSGPGKVFFKDKRRPMTEDDPYPMTFQGGEYVSMMILTKELNIEERKIADIKNDNTNQQTIIEQQ
jgi:hypothetical protein